MDHKCSSTVNDLNDPQLGPEIIPNEKKNGLDSSSPHRVNFIVNAKEKLCFSNKYINKK